MRRSPLFSFQMPSQSMQEILGFSDPKGRFRHLCERFSELGAKAGTRVRPYRSRELSFFSRAAAAEQKTALTRLTLVLDIFDEMIAEKQSLHDSPRLVWRAMKKLNLTPRSDIFSRMTDSDVIMCHALDHRTLFANLRAFDFLSLTVEDIYVRPWYELARRDASTEEALLRLAERLLTGEESATIDPGIPEHVIEELDSEEMLHVSILIKHLSPVKLGDDIVGAFAINSCQIVGRKT
jgi:hypothetical protein